MCLRPTRITRCRFQLSLLGKVPHVVGICSANTNPRALGAALRTGYIRDLIAPGADCGAADGNGIKVTYVTKNGTV